jgi:hypothetical protein
VEGLETVTQHVLLVKETVNKALHEEETEPIVDFDMTATVRALKRLEFQARKAAKAIAQLQEMKHKAKELGIEFVEMPKGGHI